MIGRWTDSENNQPYNCTDYLILHERGDRPLAAPRAACSTPLFPSLWSDPAECICKILILLRPLYNYVRIYGVWSIREYIRSMKYICTVSRYILWYNEYGVRSHLVIILWISTINTKFMTWDDSGILQFYNIQQKPGMAIVSNAHAQRERSMWSNVIAPGGRRLQPHLCWVPRKIK